MPNHKLCSITDCVHPYYAKGFCHSHYDRNRRHGDPLGGRKTNRGDARRFLEYALTYNDSDCLKWPFAVNNNGYGIIRFSGKHRIVSRLVCEKINGRPPTKLHQAAHNCGKGHLACINHGHLEWKIPKDNCADRLFHGTDDRGEKNYGSKLTSRDVIEIRSLAITVRHSAIAKRFHVSQGSIYNVVHRKTWAWLAPP